MTSSTPTFSVVIPNRNRLSELLRAVRSVPGADRGDVEVVVVDDFSDNRDMIRTTLQQEFERSVKFVELPLRSGAAIARNTGVRESTGYWVAFLDSDDEFTPEKFAVIEHALASCDEEVVFFHQARVDVDGERFRTIPSRGPVLGESVGNYIFVSQQAIPTPTIVAPREMLLRTPFRPGLARHQDLQLCLDLEESGASFRFIRQELAVINWSLSARPESKGESADFSHAWLDSNRGRLTLTAQRDFAFRYVVRKHLEAGRRGAGLRVAAQEAAIRTPAAVVIALVLLLSPRSLVDTLYRVYKRLVQRRRIR